MESYFLQSLTSPPPPPPPTTALLPKPTTTQPPQPQLFFPHSRKSVRLTSTNGTSNDTTSENNVQPPPPQNTSTELKFRRRSKRQTRKLKEENMSPVSEKAPPTPKKWEDMTFTEKAIELYVGEKGALFWLNKLAYASIYIVIGGWILFRFVGPAFNFYQLDAPPLSPTAILKG